MVQPVFHLSNVVKRYGESQAQMQFELEIPELNIAPAERIGIVAQSGLGKSTLLDLLVFAARPTSAEAFDFVVPREPATSIATAWAKNQGSVFSDLRKRHIGVVLQTGGLVPFLTARANIELPLRLGGIRPPMSIDELAQRLGVSAQLDHYPRQLSIGQRQRVAIARAIVHHPLVVVADEPTASLDQANADKVMSLMVELAQTVGVTLIMATHDSTLASRYEFNPLEHEHSIDASSGLSRSRFWS